MSAFMTLAELLALGLPGLPKSERSLQRLAREGGWNCQTGKARRRSGRSGQMEYCQSLLPQEARTALKIAKLPATGESGPDALWQRYEALPDSDKDKAKARLAALCALETLKRDGLTDTAACARVASEQGVSAATLANWKALVRTARRADWLAALAPSYVRDKEQAECHPEAWDMLTALYLRLSEQSFSACLRLMLREAKKQGWSPIPHERSLRRRMERAVPLETRVLGRKGSEGLRLLQPSQRRTVKDLHAMEAVNMDGHKFDVFTIWPGHDQPIRPMMVMIQDLYSRKILAWRLSDSENKDSVRLCIGDMAQKFGIPQHLTLDNGRAFTSKWISGGSKTRFRFKIKDSDPDGLVTALGIQLHWAIPGRGQSKPIERSFRDLEDAIGRHPACDGAYTGNHVDAKPENYASRAVTRETLTALIEQEITEHNARAGRRTEMAQGRSFDETFADSYRNAVITIPTQSQRALWLMAAEKVRTKKGDGVITLYGNRYHHKALSAVSGKDVTVRFDPDRLHQPILVYDGRGRLLCEAAVIDDTGFYDLASANDAARTGAKLLKATREQQRLIVKIDAAQLGRMTLNHAFEAPEPPRPRVRRLANGRARIADAPVEQRMPDLPSSSEALFAKGLRIITGGLED